MAKGITKNAWTRIGISTTGIAGHGGGTEEKTVCHVYDVICIDLITKFKKFNFKSDRQKDRNRTMMNVLDLLRRELEKID